MTNKRKKNLREPIDASDFTELFHFIWKHGVGNHLSNDIPNPWTDETLEAAFDSLGLKVDKRSIQNWHSGKNQPSLKNMHRLARLVSGKDVKLQRQWTDALLATLETPSVNKDTNDRTAETIEPEEQSVRKPAPVAKALPESKPRINPIIIISAFALLAMASLMFHMHLTNKVTVTNIAFCDEDKFSQSQKICLEDVSVFPADIQMIYTSFELNNASPGMPFERRWYRDGQMFKTKDGFYDEAWEGWTFLYNPNTHDSGDYVMRVIVNNRSETGSFKVLDVSD